MFLSRHLIFQHKCWCHAFLVIICHFQNIPSNATSKTRRYLLVDGSSALSIIPDGDKWYTPGVIVGHTTNSKKQHIHLVLPKLFYWEDNYWSDKRFNHKTYWESHLLLEKSYGKVSEQYIFPLLETIELACLLLLCASFPCILCMLSIFC